jgi:hypothetical protein
MHQPCFVAGTPLPHFTAVNHPYKRLIDIKFNPINADLNPICHLLALLGARHILHVSRIRVNKNL